MFSEFKEMFKNLNEITSKDLMKKLFGIDMEKPFENVKKILCIQPHPDDCEIAIGGLLAKLSLEKREIIYLTLTDGCFGTNDPSIKPEQLAKIRKEEQERAAKIIGVKKLLWLNYKDTELPHSPNVRNEIISIIRKEKPDVVFAPDAWLPYEVHPDHRNAGLLATEAVFFSSLPNINRVDLEKGLEPYEVPLIGLYYTSKPNFIIDISDTFNIKLNALKEHKSQFQNNWEFLVLYLQAIGAFYGKKINTDCAEALKIIPKILLHIVPIVEII
ncbi:MAG: PIG-L deacetylase family protein [Nitrososphaerota archaeon]